MTVTMQTIGESGLLDREPTVLDTTMPNRVWAEIERKLELSPTPGPTDFAVESFLRKLLEFCEFEEVPVAALGAEEVGTVVVMKFSEEYGEFVSTFLARFISGEVGDWGTHIDLLAGDGERTYMYV